MATKTSPKKAFSGFSDEERAAAKERILELKAESERTIGVKDVLAKIAKLPEPDRGLAKRVHTIVMNAAPKLTPKLWYGFPAYARKDGKLVCFFQYASKFKARYSTVSFADSAHLDEGNMWPVVFAVAKITPTEENKIATLVKKAVG